MNLRAANLIACGALSALLLCTASCLQSVDQDLARTSAQSGALKWELAGSFGGNAEEITGSSDPYMQQFSDGRFLDIGGLSATDDELYVCDLGISRVQVFDFNGNHLRNIGSGIPTRTTLPDDERIYYEMTDIDRKTESFWEDLPENQIWMQDRANYFKAADVHATDSGIWIADQMKSGGRGKPRRAPGLVFLGWDGSVDTTMTRKDFAWPDYIDVENNRYAIAETRGNALLVYEHKGDRWPSKNPTPGVRFRDLMRIEKENRGGRGYLEMVQEYSNARYEAGKFNGLGGICYAFDKLVACDSGNRRLQVFEARSDMPMEWMSVIRVIDSTTPKGQLRFETVSDIDIAASGEMFVIDPLRREIALLDQTFERVGAFGRKELVEPWALDLSDDATQLFVSDRRGNVVHHFTLAQ